MKEMPRGSCKNEDGPPEEKGRKKATSAVREVKSKYMGSNKSLSGWRDQRYQL